MPPPPSALPALCSYVLHKQAQEEGPAPFLFVSSYGMGSVELTFSEGHRGGEAATWEVFSMLPLRAVEEN